MYAERAAVHVMDTLLACETKAVFLFMSIAVFTVSKEADERSSDEKSFISNDSVKTVEERSRIKEARTSFVEFISSF